jgi:hypothetical protein
LIATSTPPNAPDQPADRHEGDGQERQDEQVARDRRFERRLDPIDDGLEPGPLTGEPKLLDRSIRQLDGIPTALPLDRDAVDQQRETAQRRTAHDDLGFGRTRDAKWQIHARLPGRARSWCRRTTRSRS